jgi:hypothetical protein
MRPLSVRCSAVVAALSFYKICKYLSAIGFFDQLLDLKQLALGEMIRSYKKRSLLCNFGLVTGTGIVQNEF